MAPCCRLQQKAMNKRKATISNSSHELGKARKRHRKEEEEEEEDTTAGIDRLSNLPEPIIHHILSFLDTKSSVQTSVLSRSWRFAWKEVPVLDFRSDRFERKSAWYAFGYPIPKRHSSFRRFVDKVLSLRYPLSVGKMTCIDHQSSSQSQELTINQMRKRKRMKLGVFVKAIEYALSHHVHHLVIDPGHDVLFMDDLYSFSDVFASTIVSNCNGYDDDDLGTLELSSVCLDGGFGSSGFTMLTTLILTHCWLVSDDEHQELDHFSAFPCLKHLVLTSCFENSSDRDWGKGLKVYGPHLLSLKVDFVTLPKLEIDAPKLEFFSVRDHRMSWDWEILELRLPSLRRANVQICLFLGNKKEWVQHCLISLFQGLHNVESLTLDCNTVRILNEISDVLDQQPSPFTRLKCLKLEPKGLPSLVVEKPNRMPYKVLNYFLKGSSDEEPSIEFVEGSSWPQLPGF